MLSAQVGERLAPLHQPKRLELLFVVEDIQHHIYWHLAAVVRFHAPQEVLILSAGRELSRQWSINFIKELFNTSSPTVIVMGYHSRRGLEEVNSAPSVAKNFTHLSIIRHDHGVQRRGVPNEVAICRQGLHDLHNDIVQCRDLIHEQVGHRVKER